MSIYRAKGSDEMEVRELCEILEQLRIMHDSEGAKTQARDFQKVLDILDGHEDETVVEFVQNTRQLLAAPTPSRKKNQVDEVNVRRYIESLKNTGSDRPAFEAAFNSLKNDSKMRKAELVEVARGYTGYEMSYKTRKHALDDIRAKFTEIARQEARSSIIDKITPW